MFVWLVAYASVRKETDRATRVPRFPRYFSKSCVFSHSDEEREINDRCSEERSMTKLFRDGSMLRVRRCLGGCVDVGWRNDHEGGVLR